MRVCFVDVVLLLLLTQSTVVTSTLVAGVKSKHGSTNNSTRSRLVCLIMMSSALGHNALQCGGQRGDMLLECVSTLCASILSQCMMECLSCAFQKQAQLKLIVSLQSNQSRSHTHTHTRNRPHQR